MIITKRPQPMRFKVIWNGEIWIVLTCCHVLVIMCEEGSAMDVYHSFVYLEIICIYHVSDREI